MIFMNFAADGIRQGSRYRLSGELLVEGIIQAVYRHLRSVPGIFQTFISSFLW
jgi:hypothetical protein